MQPKPASGPFRFLDLPWDIRTQIYDYFAEVPEQGHVLPLAEIQAALPRYHESLVYVTYDGDGDDDGDDDGEEENLVAEYDDGTMATPGLEDDRKPARYVRLVEKERLASTADAVPILITRRSFLSVCKQIQQEWAPKFYGSTTIIVHSLEKINAERNFAKFIWNCGKPRYNATEFGSLYLRTLQSHKICNIRRITYNATIDDHEYRVNHPLFKYFAQLLSTYPDVLQSLEVLTLEYSPCHSETTLPIEEDVDCDLPADRLRLWNRLTDDRKWLELEEYFCGNNQTAVLKGWTPERNMYSRFFDSTRLGVFCLALVLQKPDPSHPLDSADIVKIKSFDKAGYENGRSNLCPRMCNELDLVFSYTDFDEYDFIPHGGLAGMGPRSYQEVSDDEANDGSDEDDESAESDEGDESDGSDQNDDNDVDDDDDSGSGED